jgi:hypothetical protein
MQNQVKMLDCLIPGRSQMPGESRSQGRPKNVIAVAADLFISTRLVFFVL